MTAIRYSRGTSRFDAHPEIREAASFDDFERAVLADRAHEKGLAWYAAPFAANGDGRPRRAKALVESRCFIALDFDGIADAGTFAELQSSMSKARGFGYTTHSHTPDAPRCRIVLALDRPVDREGCIRIGATIAHRLAQRFGDRIKLDVSTFRGEQPVYTPPQAAQSFRLDGAPIKVDELLSQAPEIAPERKASAALAPDDDPVVRILKERGAYRHDMGGGRHAIRCPWDHEHTSADSDDSTATSYFQPHHGGFKSAGFRCLHEHCKDRTGDALLEALGVDWRDLQTAYGDIAPRTSAKDEFSPVPLPNSAATPQRIKLEHFADIQPAEGAPALVDGFLDVGGMSCFFGEPGSGKSFAVLDLALHVATGRDWMGHTVQHGAALYIALEGGNAIRKRVTAWRKYHGAPSAAFALVAAPMDLRASRDDLSELHAAAQELTRATGMPLALCVLDTLNRSMGGGDENSATDMGAVIANLDRLRAATGAHVLVIHHSGKDSSRGARGHSSLKGAVDTEIEIADRELRTVKQRDREEAKPLGFALHAIVLDSGESSCVVVPRSIAAAQAFSKSKIKPGSAAAIALECLQGVTPIFGVEGHGAPAGALAAPVEHWRKEFARRHGGSADAARKAFTRAKEELSDGRHIGTSAEFAWVLP